VWKKGVNQLSGYAFSLQTDNAKHVLAEAQFNDMAGDVDVGDSSDYAALIRPTGLFSLEDYVVYRPKSPGLVRLGRHGNEAAAFRFTAPERSCKQALALRARA
jgi:hypothetical protein